MFSLSLAPSLCPALFDHRLTRRLRGGSGGSPLSPQHQSCVPHESPQPFFTSLFLDPTSPSCTYPCPLRPLSGTPSDTGCDPLRGRNPLQIKMIATLTPCEVSLQPVDVQYISNSQNVFNCGWFCLCVWTCCSRKTPPDPMYLIKHLHSYRYTFPSRNFLSYQTTAVIDIHFPRNYLIKPLHSYWYTFP